MDNITGVIDMDGFTINKIFYCKELACIRKGQTYATSTLFDLGLQWKDLSEKDKKAARFVERYIHKIRFTSPPNQPTVPLFRLPDIVKEFFSEPDALVAYKGGHFEKDLLRRVGIPSINLESSGCPKAELLFKDLGWVETCGHHLTPNAYHHCPKVEVEAFAMWLW